MMDSKGQPRLLDFGLSVVLEDADFWQSLSSAQGTLQWMSPELLNGTQSHFTTKSDVYAYAITSWVCTG